MEDDDLAPMAQALYQRLRDEFGYAIHFSDEWKDLGDCVMRANDLAVRVRDRRKGDAAEVRRARLADLG